MTKADFIRKVQDQFIGDADATDLARRRARYSQAEIKEVIAAIENVVYEGMANLDEVPVFNGITLLGVKKEAHTSRNPRTGEQIMIPEKIVPRAKIGSHAKKIVNE